MGVLNKNAIFATILLVTTTITLLAQPTDGKKIIEFREFNFSTWQPNATQYISSTSYNAKGMAPLYRITNQIIKLFIGKEVIPEGYLIVSDRNIQFGPKVENNEWGDLLKNYWAVILVVCICALLIVLMPIIGFCFCCCRCAGACGGRSQPFDKKHDTCRRVFLGLFLILAGTGLIFGVVVAFVTNSYLQDGVENSTVTARHGVDDVQKFLKTTSLEANHLLVKNYDELTNHLDLMLRDTANVVIDKLEEKSQAISLNQLSSFVVALPDVKKNLTRMKDITNGLRVNASQLNDALRGVKRILLIQLSKCQTQPCKDVLLKYEIGQLDMNGIDYNQIPDVSSTIESVDGLISDDIIEAVTKGKQQLDNMRTDLNKTVSDNIPKVIDAIRAVGKAIRNVSDEVITKTFERISDVAGQNSYKHFNTADSYIKEYSKYSYYAGVALSSVLLLILSCVVLGLLCGICGKRPDGYGDDCCNKGAGSRFLMIGVAVIFLTISVLTACALVYFLIGSVLHRGVCVSTKNPSEDQLFQYLDQLIDLNSVIYPKELAERVAKNREITPFRISEVIESCQRNRSIYQVLRFEYFFNIQDVKKYPDEYGIEKQLQNLIDSIQIKDIEILSKDAENGINKLAQSELKNFQAYKFLDNLNEEITKFNLDEIAETLIDTANKIPSNPELNDVQTSLRNQALHLKTYQANLVSPMTEQTAEMIAMAKNLEEALKFNRSSFQEAIDSLLVEIKAAQVFITTTGTEFVKEVAKELIIVFLSEINTYLDLVVNKTVNDLGRCGPMYNVYESVLVAGCNRIIDPFNGFWAGIAWSILIFLPTIIIAVKLSSLYQKSDPYPGPLVESEYLYDAYSERDNIPLANGVKNKRRKKNERRRSSRDRRGDYYEDVCSPPSREAPSRDARYNDMAPKHWDGGPPRYQNPPIAPPASEYERPPPYYFPGAPSEPE